MSGPQEGLDRVFFLRHSLAGIMRWTSHLGKLVRREQTLYGLNTWI